MIVGDNPHNLKYLKYDSSFSLLLIDQGGLINISLSVDRISLILDYLILRSFGSTTFLFTQFFKSTPEPRTQTGSKISRKSRPAVFLVKGALKICSNFSEIRLRYECSPVNLLHILRTPFSKKTSGWLKLISWKIS